MELGQGRHGRKKQSTRNIREMDATENDRFLGDRLISFFLSEEKQTYGNITLVKFTLENSIINCQDKSNREDIHPIGSIIKFIATDNYEFCAPSDIRDNCSSIEQST